MDKETLHTLNIILKKIENIEKDISELKSFKNKILGGLAVFCFSINLIFKQLLQ